MLCSTLKLLRSSGCCIKKFEHTVIPIQDSNAERRNLTVMSVCFLEYFLADGKLQDSVLKLPVVSVEFHRPTVIATMAWVALFWFVYRYWLGNKGKFKDEFTEEFRRWTLDSSIKMYLAKRIGEKLAEADEALGWHIKNLEWSGLYLKANLLYAQNVTRSHNHEIGSFSYPNGNSPRAIKIDDFTGLRVSLASVLRCFAVNPSFSSYIIPYTLFIAAVIGGALSGARC